MILEKSSPEDSIYLTGGLFLVGSWKRGNRYDAGDATKKKDDRGGKSSAGSAGRHHFCFYGALMLDCIR
jgi:hypothetical protein